MSELSPALISIAGGNEFLFARFYHVYEGVQLVLPESPPIVSGVSDMPRRIVQTWKRHGIRCKYPAERNALNFSQRIFHPHFHLKSKGMIPSSYFFSRQTGLPAESDSPVFWCNGQKKPVYLPDICSSCFMIIFLTISPPIEPACFDVNSPL